MFRIDPKFVAKNSVKMLVKARPKINIPELKRELEEYLEVVVIDKGAFFMRDKKTGDELEAKIKELKRKYGVD